MKIDIIALMSYSFAAFKEALEEAKEAISKELSAIRTGKANPALLDTIQVEAYGSRMPIQQVANVSLEGPRSIRISPWDKSLAKAIEKAIIARDLGLSTSSDDEGVRISFPEVTGEQKEKLVRLAKDKLEEARVRVRNEREKVSSDIDKKARDGEVTEDEKFQLKDQMQELVDEANKELQEKFERKEKEITHI